MTTSQLPHVFLLRTHIDKVSKLRKTYCMVANPYIKHWYSEYPMHWHYGHTYMSYLLTRYHTAHLDIEPFGLGGDKAWSTNSTRSILDMNIHGMPLQCIRTT